MFFKKTKLSEKEPHQKVSYSQSGEDLIIDFFFTARQIDKPSYIDIGAYHPYKISNTALFYEKGARGIIIEPNPDGFEKFMKYRPEDTNLNIGVGNEASVLSYYSMNSATLNTFSEEEAKRYEEQGSAHIEKVIEVEVKTLISILEKYNNGMFPDFLSLDVEGWDYQILESLKQFQTTPKLICVETYSYTEGYIYKEKFDNLMKELGYVVYGTTTINTIYVKNELL
ncbi:FkbM family methyltransferase [Bernardetia sp. OM2101]|uniref:FkbM family methyltransferase n=1 Tax=Bernardetia sp. OM2101 TaxID=3344876 RepID=UPI0035D13644